MGALDTLLDFLENTEIEMNDKEEKEKVEEVRKTISKISIYASSTDSKMDELYNNPQVLARFLSMAKSKSEVVHQCAVYVLGNLARSGKRTKRDKVLRYLILTATQMNIVLNWSKNTTCQPSYWIHINQLKMLPFNMPFLAA